MVVGGPEWLFYLIRLLQWGLTIGFLIWWAAVMSRALRSCSRANRKMDPGNPYLLLIPFFGFIWQFIAVKQTAESLAQEYHYRGWKSDEGRPGVETGMITCAVILIVFIMRVLMPALNPGISFCLTLAICVCIFMHRERLSAFTERIEQANNAAPAFTVFEQFNNPFMQQQAPAAHPHYQQQQSTKEPVMQAPGWDGVTIWSPPSDWREPDMSDPRPWFS